jgi:putative ABC transport system permease protein
MKMIDITRRAARSLSQAKARTLLTSLAISVGAFTIVLSLAVGAGGRAYVSNIISSNVNPRGLYVQQKQEMIGGSTKPEKYSSSPTISYGGGYSVKLLKQSDIEKISKIEGVSTVTPYYVLQAEYITREGQNKYMVGTTTFNKNIQLEYAAGGAGNIKKGSITISDNYLEVLGFANAGDAISKKVQVSVESGESTLLSRKVKLFDFVIGGVTKKSVMSVSSSDGIQVYQDDAKEMYDYNKQGTPGYGVYTAAIVIAKDNVNVNDVKDKITKAGYNARTAEDMMSFIFQFINVLQGILIGFGALAVLTSVFGIINTQYISVLERTQQIGLMKALGMRRRDVGRLFKLEAAWIGFLGGSIGGGLAVIAGTVANPYISKWLNIGDVKLIIFEPLSVALVIVGLTIVSVLSGILPARKAAKLDPIVALRTE